MGTHNRHNFKQALKQVSEMTAKDWAAWTDIRAHNPALQSPYLHPEYTQILAQLHSDVRIACLYDEHGEATAFLPIQGQRFARPVGAPMSDYHAVITAKDSGVTYETLLSHIGVGAFHYSCAIDTERLRGPQILSRNQSCALNIETTAEAWREARDSSYRRHMKSTRRRIRKATEEVGEPRVELFSRNIDVYTALLAWKHKKFSETGKYDVLSVDWTQSLLRQLWERGQEAALRCDMHALYFGDELAAIDLGLSDGQVFHSWMVAYNDDFHHYAPGIQLLEGLINTHTETGYKRIDLGQGLDGYKRHYASHSQDVFSGYVPLSGAAGHVSRLYAATERWGEKALRDAPGKLRRRYSQIAACEDKLSGRTRHMLSAAGSFTRGSVKRS